MELFIIQVFLYSVLLLLVARILDGIEITDYGQALLAAFVLSVLNALIKPVVALLALPLIVLTLGLFVFVINAVMLWVTSQIVAGFHVRSFGTAVLGSLLLSIFTLGWSLFF